MAARKKSLGKKQKEKIRKACMVKFMEALFIGALMPLTAVVIFVCNWYVKDECLFKIFMLIPTPPTLYLYHALYNILPAILASEDTGDWTDTARLILEMEPDEFLKQNH